MQYRRCSCGWSRRHPTSAWAPNTPWSAVWGAAAPTPPSSGDWRAPAARPFLPTWVFFRFFWVDYFFVQFFYDCIFVRFHSNNDCKISRKIGPASRGQKPCAPSCQRKFLLGLIIFLFNFFKIMFLFVLILRMIVKSHVKLGGFLEGNNREPLPANVSFF